MSVLFSIDKKGFRFNRRRLTAAWVCAVVSRETFSLGEVSIVFTSDENLLAINREFLQHDYFTDIITFDYSEGRVVSGELYISVDTVASNAAGLGMSFDDELDRVIIHGILHLCGYKDKTPAEQTGMRAKEDDYLSIRR